jgi:hypothetical protein
MILATTRSRVWQMLKMLQNTLSQEFRLSLLLGRQNGRTKAFCHDD